MFTVSARMMAKIISGSRDGTITVWNLATGKNIHLQEMKHNKWISDVCVYDDKIISVHLMEPSKYGISERVKKLPFKKR